MEKQKKKLIKVDLTASIGSSLKNWIAILIGNKFKIDIKYIPRFLFVTFIIFLQVPLVLIERLLFDRKIKKLKIKSPVFIIGHMRSGTTFMHLMLSQDDRFTYATTAETIFPWIFLTLNKFIRAVVRYVLPSKRPMDNMRLKEEYPQEEEMGIANLTLYSPNNGAYFPSNLESFYRKYSLFEGVSDKVINKWKKTYLYFLKKVSLKDKNKIFLSKNLVNSSRIKQLLEIFPDAKFVFIYRNPYKVFLSTIKLYKKFIFKNMVFHDLSDEKLEDTILTMAKIGFEKYLKDRHLIKKGNLVEVRFEDFVKDPVKHLKIIYNKIDLDNFDKVKHKFQQVAKDYENYKADKYNINENLKTRIYNELKIVFENFNYSKD